MTIDPEDGSPTFGFDAGPRKEDIDATLERLFELPAQLAADRNARAALVFDEFQQIVDIDPRLPDLMRSIFQEQPEVAHVYLGSKHSMMTEIFNDENEPFWRSAKQMELGVIPPDLFRPFIRARFAATGRGIGDDVIARVLDVTRGHPYGTQELCYAMWEVTPEGSVADDDAFDAGLGRVLRSENSHFDRIWEKASKGQRTTLACPGQGAAAPDGRRISPPSQAAGAVDRPEGARGVAQRRARRQGAPRGLPDRRAVPLGVDSPAGALKWPTSMFSCTVARS